MLLVGSKKEDFFFKKKKEAYNIKEIVAVDFGPPDGASVTFLIRHASHHTRVALFPLLSANSFPRRFFFLVQVSNPPLHLLLRHERPDLKRLPLFIGFLTTGQNSMVSHLTRSLSDHCSTDVGEGGIQQCECVESCCYFDLAL